MNENFDAYGSFQPLTTLVYPQTTITLSPNVKSFAGAWYLFPGCFNTFSGSSLLATTTFNSNPATLEFSTPVFAFGGNFYDDGPISAVGVITLTAYTCQNASITISENCNKTGDTGFLGFSSPEGISKIVMQVNSGAVELDNMVLAWPGNLCCIVPTPIVFQGSILPQKNAVGVNYKNTVFEWDRVDGAGHTISYDLHVGTDLQNPVIRAKVAIPRYQFAGELSPSTVYKWHVRARIDGKYTEWSEEASFETHEVYNSVPETTSFFIDHLNNTQAFRSPIGIEKECYNTCNGLNPSPTLCEASPIAPSGCTTAKPCNCMAGVRTGLKWQCVEYVNRYYWNFYQLYLLTGGRSADAKGFPTNYSGARRLGNGAWDTSTPSGEFIFYPNGGHKKPQAGDIIVWTKTYGPAKKKDSNGNYVMVGEEFVYENRDLDYSEQLGHVSIVKSVSNELTCVNGNWGPGFEKTIDFSVSNTNWPTTYPVYSVGELTTNSGNGKYKCEGWLRALPALVFPADNADNVPLNPVFRLDETVGRDHKIHLYKRSGCGQYEAVQGSPFPVSRSSSYPLSTALEPQTEYMLRYETTVKGATGSAFSGVVGSRASFFKTGAASQNPPEPSGGAPLLAGCDTATTPDIQFYVFKAGANPEQPVAGGRVYVRLQGEWEELGMTNEEGQLCRNGLSPGIAEADSVYVLADGLDTVAMTLTREMIQRKSAHIPLTYTSDPNRISNIAVVPWVNGAPAAAPFVTQPNIMLRVTAQNHDNYHLIVPTELDDSLTVFSYPASQEFLPWTLTENGINPILLAFTNGQDTATYSTIVNYYPANDQDQYTYNVLVKGDTAGIGASVYVNGKLYKTLTGQDEVVKVPDMRCLFMFTKPGYVNYFEEIRQQDTILIPWQLYMPDTPSATAAIRVFLQGPYVASDQLMHDSLRVKGLIPLMEPYTGLTNFTHVGGGGEMTTPAVLAVTGPDAIVDWIFLELRNGTDPVQVIATRSALVQRDGDVVDVDGVSPVAFKAPVDQYYSLVVRHRNHLGIQPDSSGFYPECILTETDYQALTPENSYAYNGLNPAQKLLSGKYALWAGNGRVDYQLKYNGSNNDRTAILSVVGLATPNAVVPGYLLADYNLDGVVKYNGSANDRNVLLGNVGIATPSAVLHDQVAR